jgi:oxygen-independent coproporphyrinogen-3 oxidase
VDVQEVPKRERAGEYLMMRLRTVTGIDPRDYEKRFLLPFAPLEKALLQFQAQGLANKTFDGRWYLTTKGFLLSNTIISDLLLIQDKY